MKHEINILIPMAGAGTRFLKAGYELPKPLIDVEGKPMIRAVLDSINLRGQYIFITRNYEDQTANKALQNTLKDFSHLAENITIDSVTRGAAETCLLAKKYINNDSPLVITNCDQIFSWDINKFLDFAQENNVDGLVAVFTSEDPRYSYILTDKDGFGISLAEKKPISNLALTGLHFWKKGSDFVNSAEQMILKNDMHKTEFYVAPTYNYLIAKGRKIMAYTSEKKNTHIIGTPQELDAFLNQRK